MSQTNNTSLTRRGFIRGAGVAGVACVAAGTTVVRPAHASPADEIIAQEFGAGSASEGAVDIKTKPKAENGALVKIPVSIDHPMEAGNYIAKAGVIVDSNPKPLVASFEFEPEAGKVQFEVRIKMAKSSNIRVVAKTNSGKLLMGKTHIEVAEGGCLA
ncbi:MAG: twin-arginine translocation signal domain-containing protein [Magnetococcales bacterium]|nr:twin-arginine translocation signal domain-containing protein [Magnetococcales bacterium]